MASSSEVESTQLIRLRAWLRLLQSMASRGSSEIAALLIPPVLLWVSTRNSPMVSPRLALWWGVMGLMALGLMLLRRSLRRRWQHAHGWDAAQLASALPIWQGQLTRAALISGLLWASVLGFTWGDSHSELR